MNKHTFQHLNKAKTHICTFLFLILFFVMENTAHAQQHQGMLIRISEITLYPDHVEAYKAILVEEAEASVRLEKGVIAIFPMFQKDNPTQVRILEMYLDQESYQSHLKTPHFLKYKTMTIPMVKSLKLVDMEAMDLDTAIQIFKKMPTQ